MRRVWRVVVFSLFLVSCIGICAPVRDLAYQTFIFWSALIRNPNTIGSVMPSSRSLAREITKKIQITPSAPPLRILEVGAGTGAFSVEIAKKMRPCDQVDLIELTPALCTVLQERCGKYPNVAIRCLSILDWNPDYKYDFIVSGLPFNAFSHEMVQSILEKYTALIRDGGAISYFEYPVVPEVHMLFSVKDMKTKYEANRHVIRQFLERYVVEKKIVFLNLPPARVYHVQVGTAAMK